MWILCTGVFRCRFEDIDLSVRLETVKICTSFFDHQPALVEDVSGKERGSGQESANYNE